MKEHLITYVAIINTSPIRFLQETRKLPSIFYGKKKKKLTVKLFNI